MSNDSYLKFKRSAFTGSLCGTGPVVQCVWVHVLIQADWATGIAEINPILIAAAIGGGVTPEEVESAIAMFCEPDPKSRTKDFEGRRLEQTGEFHYKILNWDKHQSSAATEERREQVRQAVARLRARKKQAAANQPAEAAPPAPASPDEHPVTGKKTRVRSKRQPVQYTPEFEMWWSEFKKGHPRDGGTKSDAFMAWQTTDHPPVGDMIRIWTRQKEGVFKEGFGVKDGQGYLNRGQWQTGDVLSPEFGKMTDAQKDAIGLPRHWNSREAALLEQRAKEVEGGRGEERVFPDDDDIPFA